MQTKVHLTLVPGGKHSMEAATNKAAPRSPKNRASTQECKTRSKTPKRMRQRSGQVDSRDPLVAFLYGLARDYVTSGQIEDLMKDVEPGNVEFSNGWLANYAKDLAARLTGSQADDIPF